jgi:hypothetical protein
MPKRKTGQAKKKERQKAHQLVSRSHCHGVVKLSDLASRAEREIASVFPEYMSSRAGPKKPSAADRPCERAMQPRHGVRLLFNKATQQSLLLLL